MLVWYDLARPLFGAILHAGMLEDGVGCCMMKFSAFGAHAVVFEHGVQVPYGLGFAYPLAFASQDTAKLISLVDYVARSILYSLDQGDRRL